MGSLGMIIKYWMRSKRNFWLSFTYQLISVIFSVISPVLIGQLVNLVNKSVTETPFPFNRFFGASLTNEIRLNMLCRQVLLTV